MADILTVAQIDADWGHIDLLKTIQYFAFNPQTEQVATQAQNLTRLGITEGERVERESGAEGSSFYYRYITFFIRASTLTGEPQLKSKLIDENNVTWILQKFNAKVLETTWVFECKSQI